MAVHACSPGPGEANVLAHAQWKEDNEFEASLGYMGKLCLKTTKVEGAAEEKN